MTTKITLDDIQSAVEAQYASLDIELPGGDLRLRNPLRLPKGERDTLFNLFEQAGAQKDNPDAEDDSEGVFRRLFITVADDKEAATKFLERADLAIIAHVVNLWMEQVKPGEA